MGDGKSYALIDKYDLRLRLFDVFMGVVSADCLPCCLLASQYLYCYDCLLLLQ